MEALQLLGGGFETAMSPENLFWVLVGASLGTIIGILPGLGPPGVIAILLPISVTISPTAGLIMMAGVFYGAKYGGSTTAILLNIPGDSNAVPAAIEGYPLAQRGRAGAALGITTIVSFVAGTISIVALTFLAPVVARLALNFGPPEYFTLMLMGIAAVVLLAGDSMIKGLLSGAAGLLLATIGVDAVTGMPRFTYGTVFLLDGIDFVALTIGLYALGEILLNVEREMGEQRFKVPKRLRELLPTKPELRSAAMPTLRGSVIGFFTGVLPGAGATAASFLSYTVEKRVSKTPEKFGKGHIPGLSAPEAANNAATGGALIPLLTLGIPGGATTAILLGALILYGLQPGPLLFTDRPDVVWPIIASMYIGNVALVIMNLPLIPVFASILRLPYYVLYPTIIVLSMVGVYSVNGRMFDVWIVIIFGILGYVMRKVDIPAAPLVLAFVLGPLAERALRQSLTMSDGALTIFFRSPISTFFVIGTVLMVASPFSAAIKSRERQVKEEAGLDVLEPDD
jgi:putative tricarboxylic transport membrane protein